MIELLIAMGVMFSALVVLAYTMLTGLSAVGFSRQQTEATALANQALEQIRALPANELYMSSSDLTGDNQLVSCGTGTCFNGRTIPVASFSSTNTPLTPHVTHVTGVPGNTPYTIESYLTYDPTDPSGHTLIATVQVSWGDSQIGGVANHVQVETKVYNDQFNEAPPTVHTFTANAQGVAGYIKVSGSLLGQQVVNVNMPLPSTSAGLNGTSIPNTTNVGASGGAVTSGIGTPGVSNGITAAGVAVLSTPSVSASAQSLAGSPQSGPGTPDTATGTVATAVPGALGIDAGSISSTLNVGPAFSADAVAASNANGGASTPGAGTLPTNGLGFGQAEASQTGAAGATLSVAGLSLLGGSIPLASIGLVDITPTGSSAPDTATVAQNGSAASPLQQTYTASVNQQFTDLDVLNVGLLGLPGVPLIALTGFNKSATACAGPGTCPASSTTDTGSISILGGTPISVATLLQDTAPELQLVNNLLTGINLPLGVLGQIGVTGVGISTSGAGAVTGAHSASVGSPLTINLTAQATVLGVSLLNVNISVNLGSVSASASYS